MSAPINWMDIGKQTQDTASAEAQRKASADEATQNAAMRLQEQKTAIKAAAHAALAQILSRCQEIVNEFNSGIKQEDLKMTVSDESRSGSGILSFALRKQTGFPRITISIEHEREIAVSLQQNRVPNSSPQHIYPVNEDGQLTGPNGSPKFTANDVAEGACKRLLEANYTS